MKTFALYECRTDGKNFGPFRFLEAAITQAFSLIDPSSVPTAKDCEVVISGSDHIYSKTAPEKVSGEQVCLLFPTDLLLARFDPGYCPVLTLMQHPYEDEN